MVSIRIFAVALLLCTVASFAAEENVVNRPDAKACSDVDIARLAHARLESVVDGDTLMLVNRDHPKGVKVRLIGVNTPEFGRDGQRDQPLAKRASQFTQDFFHKKDVYYRVGEGKGRDNHNRLLVHLYNHRGESLEQALIALGLAWHVAFPPDMGMSECLSYLESEAKANGIGVWSPQIYQPVAVHQLQTTGFQRVTGKVSKISIGKSWKLWLGKDMLVVIYPEYQSYFDRRNIEQLVGEKVELRGWVYRRKGLWRLRLMTPYGIQIAY